MSNEGEDMKLQRVALVLLGMLFLIAGTSWAQKVKTDYDRSADFRQYKTYSWEQVKTKDPLMVDRIKDAVNSTLRQEAGPRWIRAEMFRSARWRLRTNSRL
jgi:hypothetical protein